MNFKITKKDKIKYLLKPLIIIFILCFIFALIMKQYHSYGLIMFLKLFSGTFAGQSFLFLIPLLTFYFNYFKKDKNTLLTIENNGKNFNYQSCGMKISFNENDIKKVIFHLSPPLFDKRATRLFWDDYFYSEIYTTKGIFKLSCLVINNLEEYINEEKIERKKVYFPLIKD